MPRMYFSGAEVAAHRNLLIQHGVESMALNLGSYLAQRQPIEMRSAIFDELRLVLYSSSSDVDPVKVEAFIEANGDRFEIIYDLKTDHPSYVPVWAGTDVIDFYRKAEMAPTIGVAEAVATDEKMMRLISSFAMKEGVRLVVNSSKADALRWAWSDVILGGWLAAMKHHELQVWDGHLVRRFSKSNRVAGAERHADQLRRIGVDADLVIDDDTAALQSAAIRSWLLYGEHESRVATTAPGAVVTESAQDGVGALAIERVLPRKRERIAIPVLAREEPVTGADGTEVTPGAYRVSSAAMQACSSCFLQTHCQSFEAGAECAFNFPVRISTKAELEAAKGALLEMQMQRILTGRFAESLLGQGNDPAQSTEMERFFRMVESMQRANTITEQITVTRKAEAGVLSRLFGAEVGEANTRLANPMSANELSVAILDADILDDAVSVPEPVASK